MIYDFMSADLIYIEFWLIIYQNIKRKKKQKLKEVVSELNLVTIKNSTHFHMMLKVE